MPSTFPVEILEQIIFQAWDLTFTVNERIDFMISSTLVSRAWLICFLRASCMHVHIPCASYSIFLERMLFNVSSLARFRGLEHILEVRSDEVHGWRGMSFIDRLCTSMTLYIHNNDVHPPVRAKLPGGVTEDPNDDHPVSKMLSSLVHFLSPEIGFLPRLKTLRLEYLNRHPNDPVDYWRFVSFPPQVQELELIYQFDSHIPLHLRDALRPKKMRRPDYLCGEYTLRQYLATGPEYRPRWMLPNVEKITVLGGNEELVLLTAARADRLKELVCDIPVDQSDLPGVCITEVEEYV